MSELNTAPIDDRPMSMLTDEEVDDLMRAEAWVRDWNANLPEHKEGR